jgi:hypothetical protein
MDIHAPLLVPADVRALVRFLDLQGTFHFPTLPSGLFSAGAATHSDFASTGYQSVWVRDNIHVAHAHYVIGDHHAAVRTVQALLAFHHTRPSRFGDLIEGKLDVANPMHRPHIRFDGRTLSELAETWAHAQNDALGYLLWLSGMLIRDGWLNPDAAELTVLADIVHVLRIVRYWEDEDSGHWEEARKIEASSIGAALAGLRTMLTVVEETEYGEALARLPRPLDANLLHDLMERGQKALDTILPNECIQPEKRREYDAALLFLIYPLEVVRGEMAETIVRRTCARLQGDRGIRRYLGDSYWCADYRTLLSADTRTADFSDNMASRDALLKEGQEAQWCIFDPIVSVIHGRNFIETGDRRDLDRQREYLTRSLSQLTPPGSPYGAYRCPESYFLERGSYVPNDITPLLWTQANLRLALAQMEQSLESM